jgi:hypothetical protein
MAITDSTYYRWRSLVAMLQATEAHPRELYAILKAYYDSNGLYDVLRDRLVHVGVAYEALQELRNPANRAVEFHAMKLWPGMPEQTFQIHAKRDAIIDPIKQVWAWSNWASRKQPVARWYACYGGMVLKVARTARVDTDGQVLPSAEQRVFLQPIDISYVSELDVDERDNLTFIRIDTPKTRKLDSGSEESYWHVEVWDKETLTYRVWEHTGDVDTPLVELDDPIATRDMRDFGIDFVPFVHAKFRDIGETRGVGCFLHALSKIDEANRMATGLHQTLFRNKEGLWVLKAVGTDVAGRPFPAPEMDFLGEDESAESESSITVNGTKVARLPGNTDLESMVPDIAYEAAAKILHDQMLELEADMPELRYSRLQDTGVEMSGKALRLLLGDAIAKVEEARVSAVQALIKAHQMALTIGVAAGIPSFKGVGTYDAGDFDHTITLPDVLPLTMDERLSLASQKRGLGIPQITLWKEMGYTEDEITEMQAAAEQERSVTEQMLSNFENNLRNG